MPIPARSLVRLSFLSAMLACFPIAPADKANLDGFDDFMAKAMTEAKAMGFGGLDRGSDGAGDGKGGEGESGDFGLDRHLKTPSG